MRTENAVRRTPRPLPLAATGMQNFHGGGKGHELTARTIRFNSPAIGVELLLIETALFSGLAIGRIDDG